MIRIPFLTATVLILIGGLFQIDNYDSFIKIFKSESTALIPLVSSDEILAKIDQGAKVVFIDAREAEEYDEDHLPGAINLTLRQISDNVVTRFSDADLVVTYCLKDFRGYELGRALKSKGVRNIRLMKDYGINGWKKAKLPIASRGGLTEGEAIALLKACAANKNDCIQNKKT